MIAKEEDRQYYIDLVEKAILRQNPFIALSPRSHAEIAIEALIADGVIFARFSEHDTA